MYRCGRCKQHFSGDPALTNACGYFCNECKKEILEKQKRGKKEKNMIMDGYCIWCGCEMTKDNSPNRKPIEHVCKRCIANREWLLRAIRISAQPAKYVARAEKRECKMREERNRIMEDAKPKEHTKNAPIPSEQEARMLRLEKMLNKLTQALGV